MTEKKGFIARVVGKFAAEAAPAGQEKVEAGVSEVVEDAVKAASPVISLEVKEESSCCGGCGGTGH